MDKSALGHHMPSRTQSPENSRGASFAWRLKRKAGTWRGKVSVERVNHFDGGSEKWGPRRSEGGRRGIG